MKTIIQAFALTISILISFCGLHAQQLTTTRTLNVAILLFDGVQIIDYTGPYEVLGGVPLQKGIKPFNVYTVSEKPTVITNMKMSVNPTYTLTNAPQIDILIVPGGGNSEPNGIGVGAQLKNAAVINWVKEAAQHAGIVMSVCNGAFILAEAGLLDNMNATTTNGFYNLLETRYPNIKKVYHDQRFVDNGKIITTGGLSSGIDGAMHLIDKLYGRATAVASAMGIEYNWDPESKYARGKILDLKIPQSIYAGFYTNTTELIEAQGDEHAWTEAYNVKTNKTVAEISKDISKHWINEKRWSPLNEQSNDAVAESSWKLNDATPGCEATASVKQGNLKGELIVTLSVKALSSN